MDRYMIETRYKSESAEYGIVYLVSVPLIRAWQTDHSMRKYSLQSDWDTWMWAAQFNNVLVF